MSTPTHVRKLNVIRTLAREAVMKDGTIVSPPIAASSETFKSINAAKRRSREMQKKEKAIMRVER